MKKFLIAALLFLAVFCLSYIGCCYLIPGFRIKLEADCLTYFLESLRFMVLVKSGLSALPAAAAAAIFIKLSK